MSLLTVVSSLRGAASPAKGTFARNRHRRRKFLGLAAPHVGALLCGLTAVSWALSSRHSTPSDGAEGALSRRMLYTYEAGVCDSYLNTNYPYLAVAMLLWGVFYMFWGLAIVCDDYFVTSLEEISEALSLSPDVAGATFMAAGSSAPELFTSIMGVFAVKNDVGIGTIVGSAVFNLCCIIGGTALFTPNVLTIDWKPITRDSIFYTISIMAMIKVLSDGQIVLWEAVILVICYAFYVLVMYMNPAIMASVAKCVGDDMKELEEEEEEEEEKKEEEEEEEEDDDHPIAKAIARPLFLIFETSIPNCSQPRNKDRYIITFTMSIFWIGVLSYFMTTWASKLGCLWGIHPAVMGVTVLAAGTSVPDAIGSLLVARDGHGDMAVSNAIGSNVFDILLGLGLPWTLSNLITGEAVPVDANGLLPSSILLLATLALVYITTLLSRFRLTKAVGAFFFLLYFVFVAYSLLHEFQKLPF